jgi:hypothetical protein
MPGTKKPKVRSPILRQMGNLSYVFAKDTMDKWNDAKLQSVIVSKHGVRISLENSQVVLDL